MNITEMQARMDAIVAAADARPVEERSLTEDEVAEYETLEADLAKATKQVELRKRHAAYKTPIVDPVVTAVKTGDDTLERAFEAYLRTGQANADLVELRAQGEGTPSAGGYTVPDGFRQKLVDRMVAFGGLLNHVEVIETSNGNPLPWASLDDTSASAEIVAESGAPASAGADLTFGTGTLGAYKYVSTGASNLALRVPVELLQDSAFDIAGLVSRKLGERLARKMAVDAVTGTGSSQPLGINYTSQIDIELATGNAVTYAKLNALVHEVDPAYREGGNCRWLMNDATLMAIENVVDSAGRPVIKNATEGADTKASAGMLLGYPITIDPGMSNIANGDADPLDGFAIFGDLRESYVWRRVKDITIVVNPYSRALNGEVEFLAWCRADGTIQNRNAYGVIGGYNAP